MIIEARPWAHRESKAKQKAKQSEVKTNEAKQSNTRSKAKQSEATSKAKRSTQRSKAQHKAKQSEAPRSDQMVPGSIPGGRVSSSLRFRFQRGLRKRISLDRSSPICTLSQNLRRTQRREFCGASDGPGQDAPLRP